MSKGTDNKDQIDSNQTEHYNNVGPIINKLVAINNKTSRRDNDYKTEYLLRGAWNKKIRKQKSLEQIKQRRITTNQEYRRMIGKQKQTGHKMQGKENLKGDKTCSGTKAAKPERQKRVKTIATEPDRRKQTNQVASNDNINNCLKNYIKIIQKKNKKKFKKIKKIKIKI